MIRRVRTAPKPSLGRLIARGVRSVVSVLPGSTLTAPIVDFVLRGFGYGKVKIDKEQSVVSDLRVIGLYGGCELTYTSLLCNSRATVLNGYAEDGRRQALCNYDECRLIEVEIILTPSNKVSSRSGNVAMAFQPYFTSEYLAAAPDLAAINFETMRRFHLSVSGPSIAPLKLRFRPRPQDGYCFNFQPVDQSIVTPSKPRATAFGCVYTYFQQANRDVYGAFSPETVAFDLTVSGVIEVRNSEGSLGENIVMIDKVVDPYKGTDGYSYAIQDGATVHYLKGTSITSSGMSGTVYKLRTKQEVRAESELSSSFERL